MSQIAEPPAGEVTSDIVIDGREHISEDAAPPLASSVLHQATARPQWAIDRLIRIEQGYLFGVPA